MLFYLLLIFAYLLGSISTAVIICRILGLPDPRTQGSNNPGATNILRIAGKKAAIITLLSDSLKGFIPVYLAQVLQFNLPLASLVGLAAFLGHLYPLWFKFRGGKGVATFLGVMFGLDFAVGLSSALTWVLAAKLSKISSLSALIMTVLTPIYFYLITQNLVTTYVIIVLAILIFWRHKNNIVHLLNKGEDHIKT